MTFEEFFKKKRIDLSALQKAEMGLFSEFKTHYHEMGEKSFDHTKKYWFNKLRREFPLAVEAKTEKPRIANPLAEQTITESLNEQIAAPKPGFTPGFKANIAKLAAEDKTEEPAVAAPPAPKPGFTPRFKAANLPKPVAEEPEAAKSEEATPTPAPPKPVFTPRFKAANMPKPAVKPEENAPEENVPPATEPAAIPTENTEAKPAYKPRFNPKNIPKKED